MSVSLKSGKTQTAPSADNRVARLPVPMPMNGMPTLRHARASQTPSPTYTVQANDMPYRSAALCLDRKSTRLNSSHLVISYAVFCLKKKQRLSLDVRQELVHDSAVYHYRFDESGTDSRALLVIEPRHALPLWRNA